MVFHSKKGQYFSFHRGPKKTKTYTVRNRIHSVTTRPIARYSDLPDTYIDIDALQAPENRRQISVNETVVYDTINENDEKVDHTYDSAYSHVSTKGHTYNSVTVSVKNDDAYEYAYGHVSSTLQSYTSSFKPNYKLKTSEQRRSEGWVENAVYVKTMLKDKEASTGKLKKISDCHDKGKENCDEEDEGWTENNIYSGLDKPNTTNIVSIDNVESKGNSHETKRLNDRTINSGSEDSPVICQTEVYGIVQKRRQRVPLENEGESKNRSVRKGSTTEFATLKKHQTKRWIAGVIDSADNIPVSDNTPVPRPNDSESQSYPLYHVLTTDSKDESDHVNALCDSNSDNQTLILTSKLDDPTSADSEDAKNGRTTNRSSDLFYNILTNDRNDTDKAFDSRNDLIVDDQTDIATLNIDDFEDQASLSSDSRFSSDEDTLGVFPKNRPKDSIYYVLSNDKDADRAFDSRNTPIDIISTSFSKSDTGDFEAQTVSGSDSHFILRKEAALSRNTSNRSSNPTYHVLMSDRNDTPKAFDSREYPTIDSPIDILTSNANSVENQFSPSSSSSFFSSISEDDPDGCTTNRSSDHFYHILTNESKYANTALDSQEDQIVDGSTDPLVSDIDHIVNETPSGVHSHFSCTHEKFPEGYTEDYSSGPIYDTLVNDTQNADQITNNSSCTLPPDIDNSARCLHNDKGKPDGYTSDHSSEPFYHVLIKDDTNE